MTDTASKPLIRLQIDVTEARNNRLTALMDRCGLSTKKDLFNNAITLLEWAIAETEKGNSIGAISRERKEYEILRMPILDHVVESRAVRAENYDARSDKQPIHLKPSRLQG